VGLIVRKLQTTSHMCYVVECTTTLAEPGGTESAPMQSMHLLCVMWRVSAFGNVQHACNCKRSRLLSSHCCATHKKHPKLAAQRFPCNMRVLICLPYEFCCLQLKKCMSLPYSATAVGSCCFLVKGSIHSLTRILLLSAQVLYAIAMLCHCRRKKGSSQWW
jgi:hypothetical protein